jgi:hypothetical protein
MDGKSKYNTDLLTHVLVEQAGWIPIDGGEYELVESPSELGYPDRVWFRSDKKTITVDADRIIAWKYAAPSERP